MNIAILTGRLVSDPEIKTTSNGSNMLAFCVAVDRGDKARTADFIDCIAWREKADFIAKWFKKGSGIEIVGELNTRTYESNGIKIKRTDLVVTKAGFVKGGTGSADGGEVVF